MPPQFYMLRDFSGGINDSVAQINIRPNQAELARNVVLNRDGSVSKRLGSVRVTTTALGGGTASFGMLHQFKPMGGSRAMVVAYNDRIATWNELDTFTDLITGLSSGKIVVAAPFKNLLYLANDTNNLMVYYPGAGSAPYIFRPGAPTPPTLTTGADAAGSATPGAHLVRIRFRNIIDDTFIGEPFPASGLSVTIPAGGGKIINLPTYTPSGLDYRPTHVVIERTIFGGAQFYFETEVALGTATYTLAAADATLLGNELMPDPGFRLPMPRLYPIIAYGNRLVGADPTNLGRIWFSEIDEFGILPDITTEFNDHQLDITDSEDAPVAVAIWNEYMVWYCGRSIHIMHIDDAGNSSSRRIGKHQLGFPNARCVVDSTLGHLLYTYQGPHVFNGGEPMYVGDNVEALVEGLASDQLVNMYAINRAKPSRRQVKFVVCGSGTQNNLALVGHYRNGLENAAWSKHDEFAAKSGCVAYDTGNKEVEYAGAYDGHIYKFDSGDTNAQASDGVISFEWKTGWFDMNLPHWVKRFEEVWLFVAAGSGQQVQFGWQTEFGAGEAGVTALSADQVAALFDVAQFDVAMFSLSNTLILHANLGTDGDVPTGRYAQFRITNAAANSPLTVSAVLVKYDIDRNRNDAAQ